MRPEECICPSKRVLISVHLLHFEYYIVFAYRLSVYKYNRNLLLESVQPRCFFAKVPIKGSGIVKTKAGYGISAEMIPII